MSYHLFLDDERTPDQVYWVDLPKNVEWVIARSYVEFSNMLMERGIPQFVTFDHDLGDDIPTRDGVACAYVLCDLCDEFGVDIPEYRVHSMNPVGAANIRATIECHKRYYASRN